MSVDQLPPRKAPSARPGAKFVRYDEYIDKQIQATRRMVKTVDVMTALLVMAAGTLGFLLVAAIVEHWLVPGGFNVGVRLVLFVALLASLSFYAARRLWPLIVGSINPAYAAHAIENDNPSLKNSLLNLLLFREHRDDITDAVYETLEEQAAKGLTRVPVESAVDRTQLLRLGYVLVGVVAAVALYKIFSPKDPFVSAERVLMPWARIASASRVSIDNVAPGAVTLARGEVLSVSADVLGVGDDDAVVVRYTTADGQAVDRPAPMTPSAAGLRFTGQIPPALDGTKAGVAQNLRYRIEAGDARSLEYAVTVVAAPTITVERIDYDYPDYTGFTDRSIDRLGDIRAIEGTHITIHALANEPIEEAAIDFEADGRRDVRLVATGSTATGSFTLELRDDRQTPRFTSYALRFTGPSARPNRDPVKYPIDVLPDFGPEVAILAPAEKVRDVRLDETVAIEVDSRDPDFALADVQLHGEAAGSAVFDEKLLSGNHTGRFTGRYLFTPLEHNLKPGDVVRYWVTARDNRAPKPNEAVSDSQTLRIVGSDPRQPGQPPQDRLAQREKPDPQNGGESKEGQQQQGEGGQSSDSAEGGQQGESAAADGQSGQSGEQDSGEQNSGEQSGENDSGQKSENQSGKSPSGGQSGGEGDSSAGEQSGEQTGQQSQKQSGKQSGESGQSQQQPGNSTNTGQGGERSEKNPSQQPGGGESQGEQGETNPSDKQPGTDGQGDQQRENSGSGAGQQNGEPQSGSESSPVSPEGDNDGEAFERIQDFLKREGKLPKDPKPDESASADGKTSPDEETSPDGETSADGENSTESSGATPSENGEPETKPNNSGDKPTDSGAESKPTAESRNEQPGTDAGDTQEKTGQQPQSSDGQQKSSEGESGAGNQREQGQGAPEGQPDTKPADKWQQKPSGEKQGDPQEPPSGGHGKRKNDSQGDQGGDHTGGGEEGAGQKSERDGTGSAGQNQSADEGAGQSSEQGAGSNSPDAGQDATSKDPTGQSGSEEQGDGSGEREGQGEQPGGETKDQKSNQPGGGDSPAGEPASAGGKQPESSNQKPGLSHKEDPNATTQDSNPQDPNSQDSASQDSRSSSQDGAGRVPNGTMEPSKSDGTAPNADDANLDYARRETDLVLETLAEQMKREKVDKRLLDKLGWTEADLKRFLDRWQQLKAAADDNSPAADDAQRELDDALRSLGLRRGQLEQAKVSDDKNRNLRQGYRGAVPLEYQERLRAYERGVSRARQSDE